MAPNQAPRTYDGATTASTQHGATEPLWTVTLHFSTPGGEMPVISNQTKRVILEHLAGRLPVLGYGEDYLVATFDVAAPDHRAAILAASATCDDAFLAADLPVLHVTDCNTVRSDVLNARTKRTPDFVGVSEIAEILGVSRQRAWQQTKLASFPAQACQLKAGPLWRTGDVTQFLRGRKQNQTSRQDD